MYAHIQGETTVLQRLATVLLLLSTPCAVFPAARVTNYSADMVVLEGGQVVQSMKLYVSGQRSRTEGLIGAGMINIVRRDRGVSYILYPDRRVYTEQALSAAQPGRPDLGNFDMEGLRRVNLGRENVLGYACTKMRVTMGNMPNGQPIVATVWMADNLGLPVRLEAMGMVQENRNLAIGPQRAALFEIPTGYTRTTLQALSGSRGPSGRTTPPRSGGSPTIGNRIDDALARLGQAAPASGPAAGSRMELNTNRMGGDYRDFDLSRADPSSCLAACDAEAQCVAWTYVKPGGPGERAHCWLKDSAMPPNSENCCVSGVKGAGGARRGTTPRYNLEMNVNRNGSDFRDFSPPKADPALCASACANESRCRAWTWVKSALEGPTGHCWLKSRVPPAEDDDCCVSGLKP
jgi:hypothetical protein